MNDTAWCGRNDKHEPHGRCRGVQHVSSCGAPWSEHPLLSPKGVPYCTTFVCPAGGPRLIETS